jgi:hypothetical protein
MSESLAGFLAACTMLLITWSRMLNQLDQHVICFDCPPSLCATNQYSCTVLPGIDIRVSLTFQSEGTQEMFMQLGDDSESSFLAPSQVISCHTYSSMQSDNEPTGDE